MTEKPPLSAADIERIRLANSGVVQDIDALCDMAAASLATAPRPAGEGEVEGLMNEMERIAKGISVEYGWPDTVRTIMTAKHRLARQQAEIEALQAEVDARRKGIDLEVCRFEKKEAEAEIASLRERVEKAEGERDHWMDVAFGVDQRLGNRAETAESRLAELTRAVEEAVALLVERKHGSQARSPGHNARIVLESALTAAKGEESDEPAITKQIADVLAAFARNALFYKPDTPHCEMVSIPFDYLRAALVVCEKAGIMPKLPDHIGAEEDHEALTEAREAHRAYHNGIAQTAAQGEKPKHHLDAITQLARILCQRRCRAVACRDGCQTGYPGPGYGWFEGWIARAWELLADAQGEGEEPNSTQAAQKCDSGGVIQPASPDPVLREAVKALERAADVLLRYRRETPPGHQPYMIAEEADKAIDRARAAHAQLTALQQKEAGNEAD